MHRTATFAKPPGIADFLGLFSSKYLVGTELKTDIKDVKNLLAEILKREAGIESNSGV